MHCINCKRNYCYNQIIPSLKCPHWSPCVAHPCAKIDFISFPFSQGFPCPYLKVRLVVWYLLKPVWHFERGSRLWQRQPNMVALKLTKGNWNQADSSEQIAAGVLGHHQYSLLRCQVDQPLVVHPTIASYSHQRLWNGDRNLALSQPLSGKAMAEFHRSGRWAQYYNRETARICRGFLTFLCIVLPNYFFFS